MMKFSIILLISMLPCVAMAQSGDKAGEAQAPLPEHLRLPASPPLTRVNGGEAGRRKCSGRGA